MFRGLSLGLLVLGLLTPVEVACAQSRERVKVTNVRMGLPPGPFVGDDSRRVFKAGQFAPVYADLECIKDTEEALVLVAETRDGDDAIAEGSIEIPAMVNGDRRTGYELSRVPYLKPGKVNASVTVRVRGAQSNRTYGELADRHMTGVEGPAFVILGIGGSVNGLRFPTGETEEDAPSGPSPRDLRGGWIQTAQILEVSHLPDHWIGYAAVDLMVLATGTDRKFWEDLAAPTHEKRRLAIAEWVRRGGRVVVSLGANADVLVALKEIEELMPAIVPPGGKKSIKSLAFSWASASVRNQSTRIFGFRDGRSEFPVVSLVPRPDLATRTILNEVGIEGERSRVLAPLAVQGGYGLGRVTAFAFDLDRPPFADWTERGPFWDNLFNQTAYQLPPVGEKYQQFGQKIDEYSTSLQGNLDFFEGVPVVSFGWVALLILIYIILIGPVDYLFLKVVFKRLEWTWLTFPVIVITVSTGAYFAAYSLKGRDLKINKVDVVDIDLAGRRIEGNTWFALFSPRIQKYTMGLEPAGADGAESGPAWTSATSAVAARENVLSWLNLNASGRSEGESGGLFAQRYKFHSRTDPNDPSRDLYADGLEAVPIQVWTTKAFSAQWSAPTDPTRPPVVAHLSVSRTDESVLVGTIMNQMPVETFSDAALVWRGRVFDLADFPTGVTKSIGFTIAQGGGNANVERDFKGWLNDGVARYRGAAPYRPKPEKVYGGFDREGTPENPNFRLWPLLFHEAANENDLRASQAPNASLRRLDQSWRVTPDRGEQALLILRVATAEGPAEEMTLSPRSPSRLWLGGQPTGGGTRPPLHGTLKQETYIRVLIPVEQIPK